MKRLGLVLLAAFAVSSLGLVLALGLQWSAGASFSPWTNYISDLSVGAGGADVAFTVVIVGLAVLTGWFFFAAPAELEQAFGHSVRAAKLGRVFGVIGALALVVMAFFPLDPSKPTTYMTHIITAVVVFLSMAGYMGAYGYLFRGGQGLFALASIVARLCAVGAFVVAVLATLTELLHVLSPSPAIYLLEWATFLLSAIWMLATGARFRRAEA